MKPEPNNQPGPGDSGSEDLPVLVDPFTAIDERDDTDVLIRLTTQSGSLLERGEVAVLSGEQRLAIRVSADGQLRGFEPPGPPETWDDPSDPF